MSDFGKQLFAKQKLRFYYGDLTEKQFRNIYKKASIIKGDTSAILIETRDPHNVPDADIVDGSIVISMDKLVDASENLIDLADLDPRLADKDALIITT